MPSSRYLRFVCHNCNMRLKATPSAAGKRGKCTRCNAQVLVPEPVVELIEEEHFQAQADTADSLFHIHGQVADLMIRGATRLDVYRYLKDKGFDTPTAEVVLNNVQEYLAQNPITPPSGNTTMWKERLRAIGKETLMRTITQVASKAVLAAIGIDASSFHVSDPI